MKKLFLVSSFTEVSANLTSLDKQIVGKKVTFIPTASKVEKVTFYVDEGKRALENLGLIVDELDISVASIEEITSTLKGNDYIYVTGGNSFYLLQEMKHSGADKIIIEEIQKGKIYIGESAGAIVLSESIEYVKTMDDPKEASSLDSLSGLSVVDFYTVPHYKCVPFSEVTMDIEKHYNEQLNLCFIKNNQGIIIENDSKKILTSN